MPRAERNNVVKRELCGCFSVKAKPCRPKREDKGREKQEDLFLVIALKARISKAKTTEVQVCVHTWG